MPNQKNLDGVSDEELKKFLNSVPTYPKHSIDFMQAVGIKVVVEKPTFWQRAKRRIKNNPGAFVLFCMQMFWPVVLLVWAVGRQFWR